MKIRVTHSLELDLGILPKDVTRALKKAFTYPNPQIAKLRRLGKWVGHLPKEIRHYEEDGQRLLLPRGGTGKVRQVLDAAGIDYEFRDERLELLSVDYALGPKAEPVTLRPDQEDMIKALLERENALARAATGAGKTEASLELIRRIGQPALVVVWESGLLRQWVGRIQKRWGWPESRIGIWGAGKKRLGREVTIAMQQSLLKDGEALAGKFGTIVGDECQRWAARTFREVVRHFPARYRIGISADERRKDGLEVLIHDTFGEVVSEISKDDLVAVGKLCEVEIRVVPTDIDWEPLQSCPPFERGQVLSADWGRVIDHLSSHDGRNALIAQIAAKEVEAGHSVLIFTQRVEHARELARRMVVHHEVPCGLMLGGRGNEESFRDAKERLGDGSLRCAVGTQKVYQGIDIPRLSVGIVAAPTATNRQMLEQQVGRLRRKYPGKVMGRLHYIWDARIYPGHIANLRRWYGDDLVRVEDF